MGVCVNVTDGVCVCVCEGVLVGVWVNVTEGVCVGVWVGEGVCVCVCVGLGLGMVKLFEASTIYPEFFIKYVNGAGRPGL